MIRPTSNRIVVKQDAEIEKSPGGIIIPDISKERPSRGTVVAVGPGKASEVGTIIPMTLKPGDTVLYGRYTGTTYRDQDDNEDYLIMTEPDVFGVLESNVPIGA